MPYNTRRKSLSLPSLGIHVPMSNAARAAAAAAAIVANSNRHSPSASSSSGSSSAPPSAGGAHSATSSISSTLTSSSSSPTFSPRSPADRDPLAMTAGAQTSAASRKIKRSHAADAGDHAAPAPKRRQTDSNTPPPSPRHSRAASIEMRDADDNGSLAGDADIDISSINDEIVEAVIVQLQASRNRPHIVKELAAVLMKQLKIVQQSANPAAIISSRLSGYLKRSCWNANNPCPLAKELETVHPRRTYFYLTTIPHQPLPDTAHAASKLSRELPTPSATSGSEAEDDDVRRRELSPSPEVDLSAPEFDDMDDDDVPMPGTPIGSYPGRHGSVLAMAVQSGRANSPPLEKDEKEFTQTADGLQKRKLSGGLLNTRVEPAVDQQPTDAVQDEHTKDETLFGGLKPSAAAHASHVPSMTLLASPAIRPMALDMKKEKESDNTVWAQLDIQLDWDRSPETVELDELDRMLTGF